MCVPILYDETESPRPDIDDMIFGDTTTVPSER